MRKGYQFLALLMMMSAAYSQGISVTFKVNTAGHPDGITDSTHTIDVRGDFNDWSLTTGHTLTGAGDYYEVTIALPDSFTTSDSIAYKFVSDNGTGATWESVDNRKLLLAAGDTIDAGQAYWDNNMPYTATDSIDVFFRVNMEGEIGFVAGTDQVYVAGGTPPLTWGTDSGVPLAREGTSFFYSGLGSFHNDSSGVTTEYKFIYDQGGSVHWENTASGSNRSLVLGADTTVQFQYFSDTPPSAIDPVTADVVFNVDIAAYETMGIFSVAGDDSMQVRGGFNGWAGSAKADGSDLFLERVSGTTIYQKAIAITDFAGDTDYYKYYIKFSYDDSVAFSALNPYALSSNTDMYYENPASKGAGNRSFTFEGNETTAQELPLEYYNGITPEALLPEGHTTTLTFTADMRYGANLASPIFDPAVDSVYWVPKDEWATHLLGYYRDSADDENREAFLMSPTTANDSIFTLTFDWIGPIPAALVYVYSYGSAGAFVQEGGGFDSGRYRCRYIQPATLDPVTWPATYAVPVDSAGQDNPLVVETPLAGLVLTNEDNFYLPNRFKVGQNYPNPFNPTTSVMFTIPRAGDVTFAVYNILGQQVVSHKQAFPAAGTYQFNWNGMNRRGVEAASGIYFYQVKMGDQSVTRKMTLLR